MILAIKRYQEVCLDGENRKLQVVFEHEHDKWWAAWLVSFGLETGCVEDFGDDRILSGYRHVAKGPSPEEAVKDLLLWIKGLEESKP